MRFWLQTEMDPEDRKQVRNIIGDEAKAMIRSGLDKLMADELQRLSKTLVERLTEKSSHAKQALHNAVAEVLRNQWGEVGRLVESAVVDLMKMRMHEVVRKEVEAAAQKVVAQKLKDKTVWEAQKQHEYVRSVVRQMLVDEVVPGLREWWREHKALDANRKAREERARQKVLKAAEQKLKDVQAQVRLQEAKLQKLKSKK